MCPLVPACNRFSTSGAGFRINFTILAVPFKKSTSMKYTLFLFLLISAPLIAQKKVLDHTVYNGWKKVGDVKVSDNGKYSAYTIKPHRGDGYLYIVNNETGRKDSIFRGIGPVFSGDNSFLAFKITPGFDTLRKNELNKVKKDKWPKDSLGIYLLESSTLKKYEKVKSFYVSPESNYIIYLQDGNKLPAVKEKKRLFRKKKKPAKAYESEGNVMVILHPALPPQEAPSKEQLQLKTKDVKHVFLPEKGDRFAYVIHQKEKADSLEIRIANHTGGTPWSIPQKFNAIADLAFNHAGTEIVFTASMDTADTKSYRLYHANLVNNTFAQLVDTTNANLPADFRVSKHFAPYFSRNSAKIFFGIALKDKPDPKDTLLESEKAKLDLWSWQDDRLQSQQLVEKEDDQQKTDLAVYDVAAKTFRVVGSETLTVMPLDHGNSRYALAYSTKPYERSYTWEYPTRRDFYRVDLSTGETRFLQKGVVYETMLAPSGNYFVYFDDQTLEIKLQYITDAPDSKAATTVVTRSKEEWLDDVNGMPHTPPPYGWMGWTSNEELVLRSKYDLFLFDPLSRNLYDLTKNEGQKQKIRYTLNEWNRDSTYIHFENTYIVGFHEKDKSMSLYKAELNSGNGTIPALKLTEQFHTAHLLSGFRKAKKGDAYLFQRSSIQDYPDVQLADWKTAATPKQISVANPQQAAYNWATVELINWKSYDGIALEGLLYKPENYDSTKKYPLLVYYYETYSDELHTHYAPRPTASIIFPTEYASAGYFVLIPDIRYKPGHPARGAYDCIMSGTDYVLRKYKSVDSTRMGLQGQSWGGYQTAQLVTMTTRYKAAMAGAPVGNMFSAYGGIRWGSGLNRQFQYERTQSRIGKTIWEAPELYIENSPLFHLPKVQTPLLIMSNDADGAVPWYQGIELFTGLNRLNKPVWLLNYNGDDHNLMKNANRIDLSIRMRQFFDHYLLNAPAPKWLKDGLPATEKGKTYGLDY